MHHQVEKVLVREHRRLHPERAHRPDNHSLPRIQKEAATVQKQGKSRAERGKQAMGKSRSQSVKATLDSILNDREGFIHEYFTDLRQHLKP